MGSIRSRQSLFEAAIESAQVFNWVASECAYTGGLLRAMHEFGTVNQIANKVSAHPTKQAALRALLDVLVDNGLAEKRFDGQQQIYRSCDAAAAPLQALDGGLKRYAPRLEILAPWFGAAHVDLIRSSNRELLGTNLEFFRSPSIKIRFDREFLSSWRINLTNPLYEFGREIAVRELVARGRRFLDLACGMGFGAERLAQYCPEGCEVVCIDNSPEMLAEAKRLRYPGAKLTFIEWDLNRGLPPLGPESFDGVLFNGSFHFIQDKQNQLKEIRAVLRPGGLLVLGHCFCPNGVADEPMHQLYFSLLENPYWTVTWDELRCLAADTGFEEVDQYHRGSHSYLLTQRSKTQRSKCWAREPTRNCQCSGNY